MNICKPLLLTLIMVIAVFGLTLTGCEKSDHPTGDHSNHDHPEAKTCCGEDPSQCCASKAVDEAKEAAKTCCGEDPSKCCASKTAEHPTGEHPQ